MLSKISLTAAAICAISVEATGLNQLVLPGTTEPTGLTVTDKQSFINGTEFIADQTYDLTLDRELYEQIQIYGVSLEVGESVKFILRNDEASDGYRWNTDPYAFDNDIFDTHVETIAPTKDGLGADGQFEITITGKSGGEDCIIAIYKRDWVTWHIEYFRVNIFVIKPKIEPIPIESVEPEDEPVVGPVLVKKKAVGKRRKLRTNRF